MTRASLALLLVAAFPFAPAGAQEKAEPPSSPFIVHEWGTFTSMQGSQGFELDGLEYEEEALPSFVYQFGAGPGAPPVSAVTWAPKKLSFRLKRVTQKMETPVIYFYTEKTRRVGLRVAFTDGLVTQWFPTALDVSPDPESLGPRPWDLGRIGSSQITWEVEVIPRTEEKPAGIPRAAEDDPWIFARDVDAAWVRACTKNAAGVTEAEHYLFYRGLGSFRLPVHVEAGRQGEGRLLNRGEDDLVGAFALEVRPPLARWAAIGCVRATGSAPLGLQEQPFAPVQEVVADLKEDLRARLVDRGLYTKEAGAMLATWSRSWFATEGSRVLYVVPRALTDRLLPLSMDPVPDEVVRVLVGRVEFITPEVEDEVCQALSDRRSRDAEARRQAQARLARLGRFLEPHLRRVLEVTDDPAVIQEARALLSTLE